MTWPRLESPKTEEFPQRPVDPIPDVPRVVLSSLSQATNSALTVVNRISCAIRSPALILKSTELKFLSSTITSPRKSLSIHPAPTSMLRLVDNPERDAMRPTVPNGSSRAMPSGTMALPTSTAPFAEVVVAGTTASSAAYKSYPALPSVILAGMRARYLIRLILTSAIRLLILRGFAVIR